MEHIWICIENFIILYYNCVVITDLRIMGASFDLDDVTTSADTSHGDTISIADTIFLSFWCLSYKKKNVKLIQIIEMEILYQVYMLLV